MSKAVHRRRAKCRVLLRGEDRRRPLGHVLLDTGVPDGVQVPTHVGRELAKEPHVVGVRVPAEKVERDLQSRESGTALDRRPQSACNKHATSMGLRTACRTAPVVWRCETRENQPENETA